MYGKMLAIQFSYNFKKPMKKDQSSFSGYLNQLQQSGDEK